MYIHVRSIDSKKKTTLTISKLTTVGAVKKLVEKELNVKSKHQKLFFRGKQLENGYKMFDYDVNVNDVIQLMIVENESDSKIPLKDSSLDEDLTSKKEKKEKTANIESLFFKVNDIVEAKDSNYGSWFEGKIIGIFEDLDKKHFDKTDMKDDGLIYKAKLLRFPDDEPSLLKIGDLRPRSREVIPVSEVSVGDRVMVNYNLEEPNMRGHWYDFVVESVKPLKGTIYAGTENTPLENTTVKFSKEIMKIEPVKLVTDQTKEELDLMQTETETHRQYAAFCSRCLDNDDKKCKECSCNICGGKNSPEKQIFCDECNMVYHLWCLDPPLDALPPDEQWYCFDCKNDENEVVKAGDKLKMSKKKSRMASAKSKSGRDWGKGMACVGRTKECTLVPANHFGPIPMVEVGTCWKFRVQVSEAGVHRPHVAGISGRENEGSYSLVLSGGYEDDVDNGDNFVYTGSGGRDLTGNKRTAEQSSDQTLTRMNKALALNCNASLDDENGAESKKWKEGKPVRVVRNYKAAKHSKYAPEEGNRYDGIYKVVKYYPEKGKSGYIVWKFVLKRDDPTPAPWTEEGKQRIASLGLDIIYPDGYLEAMKSKEKTGEQGKKTKGTKRSLEANGNDYSPATKITKFCAYELEKDVSDWIKKDEVNLKLWDDTKEVLSLGKQKFLAKVEEVFTCICCQELLFKPVTTPCQHNICMGCLKRSFEAEVFSCPYCRTDLGKSFELTENEPLQSALLLLFPGYSAAR